MLDTRKYKSALRVFSFVFILAVVMLSVSVFTTAATQAPQGVTATYSNGNITVSWNPVENATEYKIYRSLSPGNETYYANTTNTTFVDSNVTEGNTYYYKVSAVVNGNETNLSEEVHITVQSDSGGGGGLDIKKYLKFESYALYAGLFLLAAGLPLWFFGSRTHKDVAKYASLLGVVLVLFSWGVAYFNYNIENITLFNATLNTLFLIIGLIMLIVGIAIYVLKQSEHEDVAKFSAVFGLLLLIFTYLIEQL